MQFNSAAKWAGVAALLAQGALAQVAPSKDVSALQAGNAVSAVRAYASGPTLPPCAAGPVCPITAEVFLVPDAQMGPYCVVRLPTEVKYKGSGPGSRPGKFVWTLMPNVIGSASFEFQEKSGILIVNENNGHGQFHDGAIGDGSSTVNRYQFHLPNRRQVMGSKVSYYPIVLMTQTGKEPLMCAAIDPRIMND
jgi:hypothetical protein